MKSTCPGGDSALSPWLWATATFSPFGFMHITDICVRPYKYLRLLRMIYSKHADIYYCARSQDRCAAGPKTIKPTAIANIASMATVVHTEWAKSSNFDEVMNII